MNTVAYQVFDDILHMSRGKKHMLKEDFQYYLTHRKELLAQYEGKFVVIKSGRVLGAYSSDLEAIRETSKTEKLGTFLVQKCEQGDSSVSQTFHSRVAFT